MRDNLFSFYYTALCGHANKISYTVQSVYQR